MHTPFVGCVHFVSLIFSHYIDNFYERNVKFYNCGVSGGTIGTLLNNFEDDIMVHNPTHAVIMIGINDSGRGRLAEPRSEVRFELLERSFENYKINLRKICTKLEERGVKIILCTPTPYDEYQQSDVPALPGGYALMGAYAEFVRNFAQEKNIDVCDYHSYISRITQSHNLIDPDRVHPNPDGHYHMAECFLAFQGLEIGKEKQIPDYLSAWHEKVSIMRNIKATEHLVIKDYTLSTAERIERAMDYIKNGEDGPNRVYLIKRCEDYIRYKPHQNELEEEINKLTDAIYK